MKRSIGVIAAIAIMAIFSFCQSNFALAKMVTFAWDAPSGTVDYYNIYWTYDYNDLTSQISGHTAVANTTNTRYSVVFDADSYPGIHFAVSGVNAAGEGEQAFGFYLVGNIVDNFNDRTVTWDQAVVDNADYFEFLNIYYQYGYKPDVPASVLLWADLDDDKQITYYDYLSFIDRYNYFPVL